MPTRSEEPKHLQLEPPHIDLGAAMTAAIAAGLTMDPEQRSFDGRTFLTLPNDFKLVELPDETRRPPYAAGAVTVDDRESLIRYTNRFQTADSVLMADYDELTISALLDYHPANDSEASGGSGVCQHSATLRLRPSEEFARWDEMEGKLHDQDVFAAFLEENATDVVDPESATLIEISRDFEATSVQSYKSSTRLDNGDRKLIYETETRAPTAVIIPQRFTLAIPLYFGEAPDNLIALFRWRAAGDGRVKLGFQWHRVEYRRQAHFAAIAHAVSEATGRPVMLGRKGA